MAHWTVLQNFWRLSLLSLLSFGLSIQLIHAEGASATSPLGARVAAVEKLSIPIIKRDHIIGYLRLSIHIQAETDLEFKQLTDLLPLFHDALYRDLYGALSDLWIPNQEGPSHATIQKRVQHIVTKTGEPLDLPKLTAHLRELFFQPVDNNLKKYYR